MVFGDIILIPTFLIYRFQYLTNYLHVSSVLLPDRDSTTYKYQQKEGHTHTHLTILSDLIIFFELLSRSS